MLEELEQAVREAEVAVTGAELSKLISLSDQLQALIVESVGRFDADTSWALDGAVSMTGWLKAHAGMLGGRAGSVTRTANRLRQLPVTLTHFRDGQLSAGQVELIVGHVEPRFVELFAEHEPTLVPMLVGLSMTDTNLAMAHWAAKADALVPKPIRPEPERELTLPQTLDGRRHVRGHLDAEGSVVVEAALRVADTGHLDPKDDRRSLRRRRADALVDLAKFFLDHQNERACGSHRPMSTSSSTTKTWPKVGAGAPNWAHPLTG